MVGVGGAVLVSVGIGHIGLLARVILWCSLGVVLMMCGAVGLVDVSPFVGSDCWVHGRVAVWSTSSMEAWSVSSACCCCRDDRGAMHRASSRMTSRVCSLGVRSGMAQWVGKSS